MTNSTGKNQATNDYFFSVICENFSEVLLRSPEPQPKAVTPAERFISDEEIERESWENRTENEVGNIKAISVTARSAQDFKNIKRHIDNTFSRRTDVSINSTLEGGNVLFGGWG